MIKIHTEVKKNDSVMVEMDYDTLMMLRIVTGSCYGRHEYGKLSNKVCYELDKALHYPSLSKILATYKVIGGSGIKWTGEKV
jgi:hypothetical protein